MFLLFFVVCFVFFKQKTAYEMRISDWSSDVCSSDLGPGGHPALAMCAANAVAVPDPAGNRKLDKSKATGRIDGMVALAMAEGVEAMTSENTVSVEIGRASCRERVCQ